MKTKEAKLKASFTKGMAVNSGTPTNKVPILIDNNPKPEYKSSVCQVEVPKHSSCTAVCANIKRLQWIIWCAVAFIAVVVIVLFVSLQRKTSAELENAKTKIKNLESMVDDFRKDIADLERRMHCALSEDGKDVRGKRCPTEGKSFLENNNERGKTNSSSTPILESTSSRRQIDQSGDTRNARFVRPKWLRTSRKFKTTYTVWGSLSCRDDVMKLYSGRTATLHSSSHHPIGSEYMCIPDRIEYPKRENMTSGLYLSPVKYGGNLDIFTVFLESQCQLLGAEKCKNLKLKHPHLFKRLDYFQIPCAVCLRDRRTVTIVTPGRDTCQSDSWQKEYAGFLMTQEGGAAGSKLICVDDNAEGVPGSNTTGAQGPLLQPVAYKCLGASCPASKNPGYKPMALPCAVCSI